MQDNTQPKRRCKRDEILNLIDSWFIAAACGMSEDVIPKVPPLHSASEQHSQGINPRRTSPMEKGIQYEDIPICEVHSYYHLSRRPRYSKRRHPYATSPRDAAGRVPGLGE
jgi:hypothetical protein